MREEVRSTTIAQRLLACLLSIALATMMVTPLNMAEAATYTSGSIATGDEMSLSVNNGMSVLTVGSGDNAKTLQLTKELVTKDGGIDSTTGTVYLLWMSNSLYGFNYQIQGDHVQLFLVDSGVLSFTTNGQAITGYETSAGHKNLLTIDEVKAKLGISDKPSSDKPSGDNPSGDNPSEDKPSSDTPSSNTPSSNGNSGSSSNSATNNTAGVTKELKVKNNVVTLEVITNGKTKSYKLPTAKVGSDVVNARFDKNGTIWVRYANGRLDIWNYDLQKSQSKIKLYTVTKKSTALVVENGLATGYYVSGKSAKQAIWSKSKIKKKLGLTGTTNKKSSTTNTTTSTSTKRNYQMITYNVGRALQNSKGQTVDRFSLSKKGNLSYHGVKYKKVKSAAFNSKGNLIMLYNSGKLVKVKHTNMKTKKIAQNISHLNYTKRGLAKYAVRKSGTRFSVANK